MKKAQPVKLATSRRKFLGLLASASAWFLLPLKGQDKGGRKGAHRRDEEKLYVLPPELAAYGLLSLVLGRASDRAVTVSALDRDGKTFVLEADGLMSVCIQHEMDHLMGKVFVEYLSPLKRNRIKKKMLKALREDER